MPTPLSQKTPAEQAEIIAGELEGTCDSLQQALERHEIDGADDNRAFTDRLDSLVFECETCSWWYEISEMSEAGDWKCRDCCPEDEED